MRKSATSAYEAALKNVSLRQISLGGVITNHFGGALGAVDRLTKCLLALEERLNSQISWQPAHIIWQIRETVLGFDTSLPYDGPVSPSEAAVELDQTVVESTAAWLTANIATSVQWETPSERILSQLANIGSNTSAPEPHWLHLAGRSLEMSQEEPLRCYGAVDNVDRKGYQRRVVERVFYEMHGRAILADEVGLGKTIEAGLLLTEYRLRHLIKRALILVPSAPLAAQWIEELTGKFRFQLGGGPDSVAICSAGRRFDWQEHLVNILTFGTAVARKDELLQQQWDVVIVDEAHHLRNRGTQSFKLLARLRTRHLLLLTATPIQQRAEDLYSLVSLVRPTLFGTLKRFRAENSSPENTGVSHRMERLLSQVMVRNTLKGAAGEIGATSRDFRNPTIDLTLCERAFYQEAIAFVLEMARRKTSLELVYYLLAREACSSPVAALLTIQRLIDKAADTKPTTLEHLRDLARRIPIHSKVEYLKEILTETAPRKVLVCVEFLKTGEDLAQALSGVLLHGGMVGTVRSSILESFTHDAQARVLIVTPSLVEGLNLQMCSVLVNYDLPWNPMRIEQRIGRIHRIGQQHDTILVYSLAASSTIDQEMRDGLVEKIKIFERLIGPVGLLLQANSEWRGLQTRIHEILRRALDEKSLRENLAQFFRDELGPLLMR